MSDASRFAVWLGPGAQAPDSEDFARVAGLVSDAGTTRLEGSGWTLVVGGEVPEVAVHEPAGGGVLLVCGLPYRDDGDSEACVRDLVSGAPLDARSLRGSFLVIRVAEGGHGRLEAAVDRFASYRLYHASAGGRTVVAGDPLSVARGAQSSASVSEQALFDFLYHSDVPLPDSVFHGVSGLAAGSSLEVDRDGVRVAQYWNPSFPARRPGASRATLRQELRRLLAESVRRNLVPDSGCFLSGGLDSSSVVAMVREETGGRPVTFSVGFEAEGYDELRYARIVAKRFDARHNEYVVRPDDIEPLFAHVVEAYGQPFGNASVIPTFYCADLARRQGVGTLLAGDGGDELFGGNERYAEQLVFELYGRLPGWVREGVLGAVHPALSALPWFPPARKAASYLSQARVPLPDRLERYNHLQRTPLEEFFEPEFLARVDPAAPLAGKRRSFRAVDAVDDVNRMLGLDFEYTLADSDLPKVRGMCSAAGVEVRFPFLEPGLVEFAAALPVCDKVTPRRLRVFFKEAASEFLPAEVITKRKQGFGLPFGVWLTRHERLREWAYSLLDGLRGRGIVRQDYVLRLKDDLVSRHPHYYGPLVWSLIVLEGWLQKNGEAAGGRSETR